MLINIAQLTVDCDKTTVDEHQLFRILFPLNFEKVVYFISQDFQSLNVDESCAIDSRL